MLSQIVFVLITALPVVLSLAIVFGSSSEGDDFGHPLSGISETSEQEPDNITLLPLPPYSPELNPMENVWAYLRQNKLSALVWQAYDDILDACQEAWRFLVDDPQPIRSIGTRKWACVNV